MNIYNAIMVIAWVLGLVNLLSFGAWLPASYTVLFWALPAGAGAGQAIAELLISRK